MRTSGTDPSLAAWVRQHAATHGEKAAFIEPDWSISWVGYDKASDWLAQRYIDTGLQVGDCLGIYLPDGIALHVALLAAEKAGLIALGIGARAGMREVEHLLSVAGASALLSHPNYREQNITEAFDGLSKRLPLLKELITLNDRELQVATSYRSAALTTGRELSTGELFLLNSTSGTTGMPKCVAHDQARWYAFHDEAASAARLNSEDVFLGAAPPPFGFGLWTAHVTPALLGATVVKMPTFTAELALEYIERHRVTVLAAVSTQFVMMLNSKLLATTDFESLRVMFTGGERVPYQQAVEFENCSGAAVLQFYGSNETGAFTKTSLSDPQDKRLTTAGRVLASMEVRLFDDDGTDVTASGFGRPGGKGPLLSRGYYNDAVANQSLYTEHGYMLMEDLVRIDDAGYVQVAGRKGDFIIRGGKNISCAAVEEAVAAFPPIALAAAVSAPDEILGERIVLFVVTHDGKEFSQESLTTYLAGQGVSRELTPEFLVFRDDLPRSSGGKIAKGELRAQADKLAERA